MLQCGLPAKVPLLNHLPQGNRADARLCPTDYFHRQEMHLYDRDY
jgi:hypothetical protein